MFNLLFSNKKINSFEQLKENFELETVKLYYLGGSLTGWLEMCGKPEIAEKVRNIDLNKDIDIQLAEIFEQPAPIKADIQKAQLFANAKKALLSCLVKENPLKYAVSANRGYFVGSYVRENFPAKTGTGSFSLQSSSFLNIKGSFEYQTGSFEYNSGSFKYESEYESENNMGSFEYSTNSFNFEQRSFSISANSFNFASTSFTFETGSFNYKGNSFLLNSSSYEITSFLNNNVLSSFLSSAFVSSSDSLTSSYDNNLNDYNNNPSEDKTSKSPEEKIYENLSYCPLNRFGYGIHLI